MPGVAPEQAAEGRRYVLEPVDGNARYERRDSKRVDSRDAAHQHVDMVWPEFALQLSHAQAVNVTLLLQEVSRHQVRCTLDIWRSCMTHGCPAHGATLVVYVGY